MKFRIIKLWRKKYLFLFNFTLLFSSGITFAQGLQIDMSFGYYFGSPKFHNTSNIEIGSNKENYGFSTAYSIGGIKQIANNFYLRGELGYISNISFLSISYNFNEGSGEKHRILLSWLHNERIYLGVIPEYRKKYKNINFFINGGILVSLDLKNRFATLKKTYFIESYPLGLSLNGGLIINLGSIGLKFSANYMHFAKSKLINKYHPTISYKNMGARFGVLYSASN